MSRTELDKLHPYLQEPPSVREERMRSGNKNIRFPRDFPATFPKYKMQQILDAMNSARSWNPKKVWGCPEWYNGPGTITDKELRIGPGRIFGGTADLWRTHPGWRPTARDVFPGFGIGVAAFLGFCVVEQLYEWFTLGSKKEEHH